MDPANQPARPVPVPCLILLLAVVLYAILQDTPSCKVTAGVDFVDWDEGNVHMILIIIVQLEKSLVLLRLAAAYPHADVLAIIFHTNPNPNVTWKMSSIWMQTILAVNLSPQVFKELNSADYWPKIWNLIWLQCQLIHLGNWTHPPHQVMSIKRLLPPDSQLTNSNQKSSTKHWILPADGTMKE